MIKPGVYHGYKMTPGKAVEILGDTFVPPVLPDKVDMVRVCKYVAEMADGNWVPNGPSIQLTREGVLLDGTHRLLAAYFLGKKVRLSIARHG